LKGELEKVTADLRDRVVLGVQIPTAAHSALIGRGGRNLITFQNKFNVQVQYPGSNSYKNTGEPENAEELSDVPPGELVKVAGARASVGEAIEQLKVCHPLARSSQWVMLMVLQSQATNTAQSEGVTDTITVPLKYHDALTSQGAIFRTLRVFGVDAEPSAQPTKSSLPPRPSGSSSTALAARVDDADSSTATATEEQWEIVENYKDAEEGDSTWTLKGRDQAGIDKAKSAIQEAIDKAKAATHVGFLTLPDRSSFPRIVGAKGSNIARLHSMTGASIHVGRENSIITITGSFSVILAASSSLRDSNIGPISSLEEAREAIMKTVHGASRQRRGH
jgi:hypothetical protein